MENLEAILAEHAFFAGLGAERLALLRDCASDATLPAGQVLAREGEAADRFYAIREGRVAVEIHAPGRSPIVVQTLGPGEILGWSWLFPPYRWRFEARAAEPLRVLVFNGACLRGKCEADPALGYALMKRFARVMTARLEATRLQLLDLYGVSASGS